MDSSESNSSAIKSRLNSFFQVLLSYSASIALFFALPLMVFAYLGLSTLENEKQKDFAHASETLDVTLTQLVCDSSHDVFLKKIARGAWHVASHSLEADSLSSYLSSLDAFLPVAYDLYVFDHDGKLFTPQQRNLRSRFLASRLWDIVRETPAEQNRLYQRVRRQLKTFLGGEFSIAQFLENPDSMISIIVRHTQGKIYWQQSATNPNQGIIMIFWDLPALNFRLKTIASRSKTPINDGFVIDADQTVASLTGSDISDDEAASLYRNFELLRQRFRVDGDRLWAGRKVEGKWIVLGAELANVQFDRYVARFSLLVVIFALLGPIIMVKVITRKSFALSIRLKLIALFITAVFTPIMGFAYLGYRYLDDHIETQRAEIGNQSRQLLFTLDESFKDAGQHYYEDFSELGRRFVDTDPEELRTDLENRIESNQLISIELRHIESAEIEFALQNEMMFEGMSEISDAFARYSLDSALGSDLASKIDPVMTMAVTSPETGILFLFDRPDEVHIMDIGQSPLFVFWQLIKRARDQAYIFIVQSAVRLTDQLVSQTMAQMHASDKDSDFILVARHNNSEQWLPAAVSSSRELTDFANRVRFADRPLDTNIDINNRQYLVTAQLGKYASDFSFFAFYPYAIVQHNSGQLKSRIWLGIMLFVLVAIFTGLMLSEIFLRPVEDLGRGVRAIQARDAEFRIVSEQNDEFGDLADRFNQMIADLKEMDLAHDVQESLLPGDLPEFEGYEISFVNRMASAVGGDYCDIYKLDESRLCILIGDVTGHGVSSALVMAMAKAIVYQGLKEGQGLVELMSDLNAAIFANFRIPPARKMITLFAAIIHTQSGKIEFCNAGHNFPMHVKPNAIIELNALGMPIGASRKLRSKGMHSSVIQPGEMVLFYTDGLVEAKNPQNELYGYDRLKEELARLNALETATVIDRLMNSYDGYMAGCEPDDDITLILVRRLNSHQ